MQGKYPILQTWVQFTHDTKRGVLFTLSAPLHKRRGFSTEFSSMAIKFSLFFFQYLQVHLISQKSQMGKATYKQKEYERRQLVWNPLEHMNQPGIFEKWESCQLCGTHILKFEPLTFMLMSSETIYFSPTKNITDEEKT